MTTDTFRYCTSFKEWPTVRGMGSRCTKRLAHERDHVGEDGMSWPRTHDELILLEEIKRLQLSVDSVNALAESISGNMTGKFIADEIRNRLSS